MFESDLVPRHANAERNFIGSQESQQQNFPTSLKSGMFNDSNQNTRIFESSLQPKARARNIFRRLDKFDMCATEILRHSEAVRGSIKAIFLRDFCWMTSTNSRFLNDENFWPEFRSSHRVRCVRLNDVSYYSQPKISYCRNSV